VPLQLLTKVASTIAVTAHVRTDEPPLAVLRSTGPSPDSCRPGAVVQVVTALLVVISWVAAKTLVAR
jgi:hypothetical protein